MSIYGLVVRAREQQVPHRAFGPIRNDRGLGMVGGVRRCGPGAWDVIVDGILFVE
jgi:hypothetical protein